MSASRKAVCEFYFHMARHTRATPAQCQRLLRYAATLQRLAEAECNGYPIESGPAKVLMRDQRKRERIQAKVAELCVEMSEPNTPPADWCKPVFSGDPRGSVLKIRVPDGFTDDLGQEGICVPA